MKDMDEVPNSDESILAAVEQAEVITEAWIEALRAIPAQSGASCPTPEELESYLTGAVDQKFASSVAAHLGNCRSCREKVRESQLLFGVNSETGSIELSALRAITQRAPDLAAKAFVQVSKQIVSVTLAAPPEEPLPRQMDLGVSSPDGEAVGEWLSLVIERAPWIDSTYRFCVDVQPLPALCEGLCFRLFVKSERKRVEIGVVPLREGLTRLTIDLRDLYVKPGYFSLKSVEIIAEQLIRGQSRSSQNVLATGPQSMPATMQSTRSGSVFETMSSDQLRAKLPPEVSPQSRVSPPEESMTKVPGKRRKEKV